MVSQGQSEDYSKAVTVKTLKFTDQTSIHTFIYSVFTCSGATFRRYLELGAGEKG